MIYDRETGQLIHDQGFGSSKLSFLYSTVLGRILLRIIVSPVFSWLMGQYYRSKLSVPRIRKLIAEYRIDENDYVPRTFMSFNDFFTRKLSPAARPFSSQAKDLIAVADAKLTSYSIDGDLKLDIKGGAYSVADILGDASAAAEYADGTCLVFRLSVDDCHRYIFCDDGVATARYTIPGVLHTVQPIAHARFKPYAQNNRVITKLSTKNFGDIIAVEVGALLVGVIKNHEKTHFVRGDEKGYFELGGSTIALLFKQGAVRVHDDIVQHSREHIETKVKRGEVIGRHA